MDVKEITDSGTGIFTMIPQNLLLMRQFTRMFPWQLIEMEIRKDGKVNSMETWTEYG